MAISDQHPVSIQKEPKILNFKKKLQEDVRKTSHNKIRTVYLRDMNLRAPPVVSVFLEKCSELIIIFIIRIRRRR